MILMQSILLGYYVKLASMNWVYLPADMCIYFWLMQLSFTSLDVKWYQFIAFISSRVV